MRKLLNNLYITQPDVNLGRDGKNIVIYQKGEKTQQFPVQYFENIICMNYTGMSPALMELCLENNVNITFLSQQGKIRARVVGHVTGNVLLRQEQFRIADDEARALEFARLFMHGKLYNSIQVLKRGIRDYPDAQFINELQETIDKLLNSKNNIGIVTNLAELLGVEGDSSRNYFQVFDNLIVKQKSDFTFEKRVRRPPTDPTNAMLSLTYGMVRTLVESALTTVGLDPFVGFFHQPRPGRTSLALDLMEELRAYMADRFVLTLINRQQIKKEDFFRKESGAYLFTEESLKKYLNLWNKRLFDKITHPYLEEKIEIGLIPYTQAVLLARTIRGDLNLYPPFMMN